MKSKTLKAMIGGSVAAVMALSISLPLEASAASNEIKITKSNVSYEQLLKFLSNYNIQVSPFIVDGNSGVAKPQVTTAPAPAPAKPVVTPAPAKPTAAPAPAKPAATPAPAKPAAATAPASNASTYTGQIVTLVNKERAAAGLAPVSGLDSLNKVAAAKATDMRTNNYFSHTSPTYGSPFDMMAAFGVTYRAAGENIAMGQRTPQEVMTAWMKSPGHRANILNKDFNYIGVGFDNNYWVQEFIGK